MNQQREQLEKFMRQVEARNLELEAKIIGMERVLGSLKAEHERGINAVRSLEAYLDGDIHNGSLGEEND